MDCLRCIDVIKACPKLKTLLLHERFSDEGVCDLLNYIIVNLQSMGRDFQFELRDDLRTFIKYNEGKFSGALIVNICDDVRDEGEEVKTETGKEAEETGF